MLEPLSMVAAMVLQGEGKAKKDEPAARAQKILRAFRRSGFGSLEGLGYHWKMGCQAKGGFFEGSTLDRIWPSPKKLQPLGWWTSSPAGVRN